MGIVKVFTIVSASKNIATSVDLNIFAVPEKALVGFRLSED